MTEIKFPQFINDYPIGEDHFEGKSQEKVADNVISYIKENSTSKKRVIGIEGEWGAGKSNVIEIIRKKTTSDFQIFTFDAWGHQEDLTRRTFLEELTDDLVGANLLPKKWEKTLKERLATNVTTSRKEVPSFNPMLVILAITLLCTPTLKTLLEYIFLRNNFEYPGILSFVWTIIAFIVVIGISLLYFRNKADKLSLGQLLYVYHGNQIKTDTHETITSLEPSVKEFRTILNDIVKDLKQKQKLVFVFDNMDRLPVGKVKEIWSSIHTFFAEVKNNEFDSWVLIPYDQQHICKVFSNDGNTEENELTVSYIQKTFSIVFRISPPILSDWKVYFDKKFNEAFGFSPPASEQLGNLFDYLHDDNTIKPRQIITYINNLVALNKQWGEKIPLKYCGLFILTQKDILKDPIKKILEREFVKKVASLFSGDTKLETYISALVFNVEINRADEVLLRRSVEKGLRGEIDFIELAKHPAFSTVLDTCFYGSEINESKLIVSFNDLPMEIKGATGFEEYWKHLQREFEKSAVPFPEHELLFKTLVLNLVEEKQRVSLTKHFINKILQYKVEDKFEYRGDKFSEIIDSLILFVEENKLKIDIFELIPKETFEPEDYINFFGTCNQPFNKYNITCDVVKLNNYLIGLDAADVGNYEDFLRATKEYFDFSAFVKKIEKVLNTIAITDANYQAEIMSLLTANKALTKAKPFTNIIPSTNALAIFVADVNQPAAVDLVFSILADKPNLAANMTNAAILTFLTSDANVKYANEAAEYYINYGELILLATTYPYPLLLNVVKDLTVNVRQDSQLSIKHIISSYEAIKKSHFSSDADYENMFLKRLNYWHEEYAIILKTEKFSDIISLDFIMDCTSIENDLSAIIIEKANGFITSATESEWDLAFEDSDNSFLFQLTVYFIDNKLISFKTLPEQVTISYKNIITAFIDAGEYPDNVGEWEIIIDFLDSKGLGTAFKNIRDKIIYNADDVSPDLMFFLKKGLFKYGGLNDTDKVDDVIRKIILPSIKDEDNLSQVIFSNDDFVKNMIDKSTDLKPEVHEAVKARITDVKHEKLEAFANKLGIDLTKAVDENTDTETKTEIS